MKAWLGFGSEHSSSIVMIGEFRTAEDAASAYELIEKLRENASSDRAAGVVDSWEKNDRYSPQTEKLLRELKLWGIAPDDIADFANLETTIERSGATLQFWTDDVDIGGFIKLMVDRGAKVQVYSKHSYPDD
jgi:Family of unknown function (DUF6375)